MKVPPVDPSGDDADSPSARAARDSLAHQHIQAIGEAHFPDDAVRWEITTTRHSGPWGFAVAHASPPATGYERYVFVLRFAGGAAPRFVACYAWSGNRWIPLSADPGAGDDWKPHFAEYAGSLARAGGDAGAASPAGEPVPPRDRDNPEAPHPPPSAGTVAAVAQWFTARTRTLLATPSAVALLGANVVPAAGALWYGWDVRDLLLVYWGESAVIGGYTLIKLAIVTRRQMLLLGPFFVLHFGGILAWCLGVFLVIVHEVNRLTVGSYQPMDFGAMARELAPVLVVFLLSHGVSFVANFLGRREYLGREARDLMLEPYRRVAPMLGMACVGAFVVSAFGDGPILLIPVVIVKVLFDLAAHGAERLRAAR